VKLLVLEFIGAIGYKNKNKIK